MQHDNTVFVVDPDETIGDEVTALLGVYDISARVFPNAEDFLEAYPAEGIGTCCLLVEAELPGISGLLLLQRLRARGFDQLVIFLTDTVNCELRRQAMEAGV